MKQFRPQIMALPLEKRLELAASLLDRHIGELGHGGIYILGKSAEALTPDHFDYLDRCLDDFRSWSHVDHFCGEVTPVLLLNFRDNTLAQLEAWSQSDNRFKRRTSVVAFARKVGASGLFLEECLAMCEVLIWDPEDIVRKGVGWALKEQMKVAPEEIKDYVKKLRRMGVSSTITLYAIRDLEGKERKEMLAVKKG
jgi:3-methyladenine DNA glycosylase AlkD